MLLDPAQFYRATLANDQVVSAPDELAKFAEAKQLPLPVAAVAKAYYEQLCLDDVKYASEDARQSDAIEMAKAYFAHREEAHKTAATFADGIMQKLAAAAQAVIDSEKLEDVTPFDLLKIAALQAETALDFEVQEAVALAAAAREREAKIAAVKLETAKIAVDAFVTPGAQTGAAPVAPAPVIPGPTGPTAPAYHESLYLGGTPEYQHLHPEAVTRFNQRFHNVPGNADFFMRRHGLEGRGGTPEQHVHNLASEFVPKAGGNIDTAVTNYHAHLDAQNRPGWFGRNAKWAVPGALLGAGAMWWLHKRKQDEAAHAQQQAMQQQANAAPA